MSSHNENTQTFEDILYSIGDNGPFQKRFNFVYNGIGGVLMTTSYLNVVFALMVADHWCFTPGQNLTNLTTEEWKSLTLPLKYNISGKATYSSCTMYNISNVKIEDIEHKRNELEVIGCQYGWDYSDKWFTETLPSQQNWVCEKNILVTNAFTFLRLGELIGGVISGIFTDTLGRYPTYFMAALTITFGRLSFLITYGNFILFICMIVISSTASTSMYQSSLITGFETTSPENRAGISILQQLAWSLGICILPVIMWLTGHWIPFIILTSLPGAIFCIITARGMIESPRWLLNHGNIDKCIKELEHIAKINKTQLPADIYKQLDSLPKNTEKPMGFISLFLHWRIAKNSICSSFCWCTYQVIYFIIVLNIGNLGGNPLLNFFLQSVVEVPGYILSKISSDYFGRRLTHVTGYIITALCCAPLVVWVSDQQDDWLGTTISILIKFTLAFAFYSTNLLCYEIYPTCLRQTGLSLCSITSNAFSIIGPYIVHLGTTIDGRIPYLIIFIILVIATICAGFLPETLHHNLPDTIAEAEMFGENQKFWSIPKREQDFEAVSTN